MTWLESFKHSRTIQWVLFNRTKVDIFAPRSLDLCWGHWVTIQQRLRLTVSWRKWMWITTERLINICCCCCWCCCCLILVICPLPCKCCWHCKFLIQILRKVNAIFFSSSFQKQIMITDQKHKTRPIFRQCVSKWLV